MIPPSDRSHFQENLDERLRGPDHLLGEIVGGARRHPSVLDAFRERAMHAHWRDGLDLERDEDPRRIAADAGLDPDAAVAAATDPRLLARVDALREQAEEIGVTGIPTFIFGGRVAVVGCQPYEVLARAAERAGGARRAR